MTDIAHPFDDPLRLTEADIPDALGLSIAAGWNQNAADWRTMLELGHGWGIRVRPPGGSPVLAASIVVLPYDGGFAWVSMVLVLPPYRGAGLAQRLLQRATAHLAQQGMLPVLDATPAGHAVYARQGFRDTWGFARYQRDARVEAADVHPGPAGGAGPSGADGLIVRLLHDSDWPQVARLDRAAFGASRQPLLRALARRLPAAAHVAEDRAGGLAGFVLARDGREASQLGPLIARDVGSAQALCEAALATLPGRVFVDLVDHRRDLLPWLQARGFVFQRPFTRMVQAAAASPADAAVAPGDPALLVLVAGPELG